MLSLERLQERASFWRSTLNLEHWQLDVELTEDIPEGCLASCEPSEQADRARILVCADLEERTSQEPGYALDYALVHEMFHMLLRDIDVTVEDMIELLGPLAGEGYKARWTHVQESAINRLTQLTLALYGKSCYASCDEDVDSEPDS